MCRLLTSVCSLYIIAFGVVEASGENKSDRDFLVAPDFTIFDIQHAYPDDVTFTEVSVGIVDSVATVVSRLPEIINRRFSRALMSVTTESPFAVFTLAGAIHFAQLALYQKSETKDWILFNIVLELLDAVIRQPRIPLEKRLNSIYKDFSGDMRTIFGNTRVGILTFEAVAVFLQLDTIPVTDRRNAMVKFLGFLNASKGIINDRSLGGFDKAQRILVLRESFRQVLKSTEYSLINPPLTAEPEATRVSGSKRRWSFLNWYRIL